MSAQHLKATARRVVAGVDADGGSTTVSDADTTARVATEAFTINQVWQMDALPPQVLDEDATGPEISITPPGAGFIYLLTTFAPDSEWDPETGYAEALQSSGGGGSHVEDGGIAGLHETDTVDIITVVSGEVYAVLEKDEVLLKAGDSFVQRGTKHAWSNRSDQPCTIVAVMVGARR